jgi:HD-like signal output (HDOD) protein
MEKKCSLVDAEYEIYGTSHAEAGAYLLGLWGIPEPIVESIAFHHYPSRLPYKQFTILTALNVANGFFSQKKEIIDVHNVSEIDYQHLKILKIEDHLNKWFNLYKSIKKNGIAYES